MAETITFYMDEHVPRAVTEGLRQRGVDVLRAQEAGMLEAGDERRLASALREGRVIFTQDADFLRFHAAGRAHSGIVYARQRTAVATIIHGLMLIHDALTPEEMFNHVEFL